jgi:hypothetical protein
VVCIGVLIAMLVWDAVDVCLVGNVAEDDEREREQEPGTPHESYSRARYTDGQRKLKRSSTKASLC